MSGEHSYAGSKWTPREILYFNSAEEVTATAVGVGALFIGGQLYWCDGENLIAQNDHAGGATFGADGNTLTISDGGAVTLAGTAKITHHEQVNLSAVSFVGTTDGSYATVVGGKLVNQNTDIAYLNLEVYAAWDGDDVFVEVDWLPTTAITEGETVIWKFDYKAVAEGEDADTGSVKSLTVTHTAPVGGTAAGVMVHSRTTLAYDDATQPLTAQDHIYLKIYRDATTDTFAGDALVTAFEYIWTAAGLSNA